MFLDRSTDGASGLLPDYNEETRRLITILCLPLVDGVFATLLVTGAVQTFSDVVAVSLTIFTGAGALAVLYSSTESSEEARKMVLKVAPVLLSGAVILSLVAPVFEQLFYVERMRTVAGLVILAIALHILQVERADFLSVPAMLITGIALSIKNPGALQFSLSYVFPAALTALTAIFALYLASYLDREKLELSYIRGGAGLVLSMISLSLFGINTPSNAALGVFAASVFAAYRPLRESLKRPLAF